MACSLNFSCFLSVQGFCLFKWDRHHQTSICYSLQLEVLLLGDALVELHHAVLELEPVEPAVAVRVEALEKVLHYTMFVFVFFF